MRAVGATETQEGPRNWGKMLFVMRHTPPIFRLETVLVPLEVEIYDEIIIQEEYWRPNIAPFLQNELLHPFHANSLNCIKSIMCL